MTTTSTIPLILDTLVAQYTTAFAATALTVHDGPHAPGAADSLCVGGTSASDGIPFTQEWAGTGGFQRDEKFDIPNELHVVSGGRTFKAVRDRAYAYLATIENLHRTTPSLGLSSGLTVRTEFGTTGEVMQGRGTGRKGGVAGPAIRVRFTIRVETRI